MIRSHIQNLLRATVRGGCGRVGEEGWKEKREREGETKGEHKPQQIQCGHVLPPLREAFVRPLCLSIAATIVIHPLILRENKQTDHTSSPHLTASPPHFLTSSLPHLLTSSPPHLLTSSPPHLLTSSSPHLLTYTFH